MEDLEGPPGSPQLLDGEEPQGLNDPRDTQNANYEEEHSPDAPIAEPTADVDTFEDDEAPETVEKMNDGAEKAAADDSDNESELEELDETQFQDFDAAALNIPVAVDESNVGRLGVHKRKRTEEEERERKKKKKEGKREKPKRRKKETTGDDDLEGGVEIDGKRARKGKVSADGQPVKSVRRAKTPEDEESLTPDEREHF